MIDYTGMIGMTMLASMMRGLMLQTSTSNREIRAREALNELYTKREWGYHWAKCPICGYEPPSTNWQSIREHLATLDCLEILEGLLDEQVSAYVLSFPIAPFRPKEVAPNKWHRFDRREEVKKIVDRLLREYEEQTGEGPDLYVPGISVLGPYIKRYRAPEPWVPEYIPVRIKTLRVGTIPLSANQSATVTLETRNDEFSEYIIKFSAYKAQVLYIPFGQTEDFFRKTTSMRILVERNRVSGLDDGFHYLDRLCLEQPVDRPDFLLFGVSVKSRKARFILLAHDYITERGKKWVKSVKLTPADVKNLLSKVGSDYYERTRVVG